MLVTYVTHKEIDRSKWDLCIEQSVNAIIYASSWYLDEVSPNWEALILGDYEAVMPLTYGKKYGLSYLFQPFFTQQLGVFSKHPISQEIMDLFIESIPRKFRFIDIQLNEQNQLISERYKIIKRKNYLLNLNKTYEKLNKSYNTQTKRNLKKAKKFDLELKTISHQDVVSFYKLHKAILTKGVKDEDYNRLLSVLKEASERKKLMSRGVFSKTGELLASAAFLTYKNRIIFLIGTASETGKEYGAMYQLMDYIIFQFAGNKTILDFEGSDIPGIARFFKGLGAEKETYYRLKLNRLPWILRLFKN